MKNKHACMALLLSALPALGAAQIPAYDEAVESALQNAHDIQADSLRNLAAVAEIRAENTLAGPEAEFEYLFPAHSGPDNRWSAGVTQSFDWPGAYRARSREARAQQATADAVLRGVVLDKALQVKLLIIDLVNARHRLDFYNNVAGNVARMDSLVRRSFDLGNMTVLDVRKAALALVDARRQAAAAQADYESVKASLEALCGQVQGTEAWTVYPLQEMPSEVPMLQQFPQIQASQLRIQEGQARLNSLKAALLPSFAVGYRHAYEDGTHFNGFGVSVTLPAWSRSKRTEAARLEAEAAARDLAFAEAQIAGDLRARLARVRILKRDVVQYRTNAGDDSYLELLRKAFDGGELTVIDYIKEVQLFSDFRLKYLDLDYQLQLELARLNSVRSPYFN